MNAKTPEDWFSERIHKIETEVTMISTSLDNVVSAITSLAESVKILSHTQEKFTKWLLIVVCVIALGRGLIEVANELFAQRMPVAQTN